MKNNIYWIPVLLLALGLGGCGDGATKDFSSITGKWVAQRDRTLEAIAVFTVLKDRVVLTRYSTEDGTLISQSAIDADMLNGTLRLNPRKKGESQFVLNSSGNKLNCTNCPVKDRYNVWVKADVDQLWEVQNYGKLSVDLRGYKYALDLAGKPTVEGY